MQGGGKKEMKNPQPIIVYCDGLCEPNPGGWATWGWIAVDAHGREISHAYGCLGHGPAMTNNKAEYEAVLQVLRRAVEKDRSLDLRTDSRLVVEQILGHWQVKTAHLYRLVAEGRSLLHRTCSTLLWVPREDNHRADALTRKAYQEARSSKVESR